MSAALTRLKTDRPVRWTTVVGILLVPLTVAGVLLWGLWNPTERLENVTAAVVNLDESVTVDGQTVPLGRVLAGELIGSPEGAPDAQADTDNFTWVLTDADDAREGVADGRYATVVTIPRSFSADATSLSRDPDDATQARIDITESQRGRLIDTALSGIVTQTATRVLNEQLGEQFVDGVYVGFNRIGDGIGEAATGATQLASGTSDLAQGASELDAGAAQLADGTRQLSDGTQQLAAGAGDLSSGAGDLSAGASSLASNLRAFATGTPDTPGLDTLAANVASYTAGVNTAVVSAQQGQAELVQNVVPALQNYRDALGAGLIPLPSGTTPDQAAAQVDALIAGISAPPSPEAAAQLQHLLDSGPLLAQGAQAAAGGAAQLADGADQLSAGAGQLASGAAQLSTGTSQLAANAPQLADGASQLADGTSGLVDGSAQLAGGAGDLAKGLDSAAQDVPKTTDGERERISKTAATPVQAAGGSDELFNASGVPLFAGIALWAGALAAFLVLAPLWRRSRDAARGVGYITLRSALPAIGLGAIQGVIAGIVLPIALGYDIGQGARFFGFAVLAGIAFALMVQGLSALLGGLGRFVAFVLLVVAFAVGIVSTVPGQLAAVGDASPLGAALGGFQSIATGSGSAGAQAVVLALWGAAGLVLTALAVVRARRAR